jgi:hypothetical protein
LQELFTWPGFWPLTAIYRLPQIQPLLQTAQQLIRLLYGQLLFFFLLFQIIHLLFLVPLATAAPGLFQQRPLAPHDINYYLSIQPPECWLFVAVADLVAEIAALLFSGIIISLAFALPQILFADQSTLQAYQESKKLFKPGRLRIFRLGIKFFLLWTLLVVTVTWWSI